MQKKVLHKLGIAPNVTRLEFIATTNKLQSFRFLRWARWEYFKNVFAWYWDTEIADQLTDYETYQVNYWQSVFLTKLYTGIKKIITLILLIIRDKMAGKYLEKLTPELRNVICIASACIWLWYTLAMARQYYENHNTNLWPAPWNKDSTMKSIMDR